MLSLGSLYCLIINLIYRNILQEICTVKCEYLLINRSTAGKMNHFANYKNYNKMHVISGRILLGLALLKEWVTISPKCNQQMQIIMNTIIDGRRF